jgi:hypothetical protein
VPVITESVVTKCLPGQDDAPWNVDAAIECVDRLVVHWANLLLELHWNRLEAEDGSMPFRDHFRPPVSKRHSWEEVHGGWPMMIVQKLAPLLPDGYQAAPRVHLGSYFEVDSCSLINVSTILSSASPQAFLLRMIPFPSITKVVG